MEITLVFAGSYIQFDFWRRTARPGNYKYCSSPEDIQGARNLPVKLVGTYWENPTYKQAVRNGVIGTEFRG